MVRLAAAVAAVALFGSCLVQGKQYRDETDTKRHCVIDDDCYMEEICEDLVCVPAPGCVECTSLPNGKAACFHGLCLVEACESGWHDANGLYQDGCEYACEPTNDGVELCDETDNDCDGLVDEDYDLKRDPENCGECGHVCSPPEHAEALCVGGICYFQCEEGWYDNDLASENGCEADVCEETFGGVEQCDLRDNDCDGTVDEGFVKDVVGSCGPLCEVCELANASALCVDGRCELGTCDATCQNLNGVDDDGCEYCCEETNGGIEICDDLDNDCNGLTDEGLVCDCPTGMVNVESLFCLDEYEASRPDATSTSEGTDSSVAMSVAGVMPWSHVSLSEAAAACAAAGKRLCTPAEWEQACRGPSGLDYSYGESYDPVICNGIDTFCNCGAGSGCEDADPCPYPHCYWDCGAPFHPTVTGAFPDCVNAYGAYDVTGNMWDTVEGGMGRGGAYNCGNSEALHTCSYEADWAGQNNSNFGFRCCCTDCPNP
jgi:hypothetical protein